MDDWVINGACREGVDSDPAEYPFIGFAVGMQ